MSDINIVRVATNFIANMQIYVFILLKNQIKKIIHICMYITLTTYFAVNNLLNREKSTIIQTVYKLIAMLLLKTTVLDLVKELVNQHGSRNNFHGL
jgi:hypothetical protein